RMTVAFFFASRRRHTRSKRDWSSDVCSSDLKVVLTLVDLGVSTTFVDPWDLDAWERAIRPETRAVLVESIANPGAELVDLDAIKIGRASCRERVWRWGGTAHSERTPSVSLRR